MDAQQVMELVEHVLGRKPLQATHMPFGHNSVTFDVALPDRNVIVRTNQDASVFARTEHNLAILAQLGLPVPKTLAIDLTRSRVPFTYMILEKIPGRDLRYELAAMSRSQMTGLAEQIVSFQRSVATLPPGAGFGYVSIGERGPYESWWQMLRIDSNSDPGTEEDPMRAEFDRRIRLQLARFQPYFEQVPPICFLDDVTVKNVIVQNGELRGVVDFDCVCYGDPLYWMALTTTGVVSDVGTHGLFYVKELERLWELTGLQRRIVALYSASMGLYFIRRFAATETEVWKQRMADTIERWLVGLERDDGQGDFDWP